MKNLLIKNAQLFFTLFLLFILHLPFVFANTKPKPYAYSPLEGIVTNELTGNTKNETIEATAVMYDSLHLQDLGLCEQAFDYAVKGYEYMKENGRIINENVISIVDFTKPSSQKRLFVVDLKLRKILFNTYVAHGQSSGKEYATHFSNKPESFQSSLGFYLTSDTYTGKNGFSLHLNGIEKGINDKAEDRAIVMHGAPYVSESLIRSQGYIGRSWGCPAVPEKLNKPIIEKIKNGSCLFIYGKNKNYFRQSKILNS